ncbi:MAG: VOC family protein [Ramlibacter sp.]
MDPVVHFELPCDDRERISRFFTQAFGWKTQMLGPEMGNYVVVTTAEPSAPPPVPPQAVPGCINGGFFTRTADMPAQFPGIVVAVQDVRASMKKVAAAGGKVLGEPMTIPGVGDYVAFLDTEGNRSSMLQPLPPQR